MNEENICSWEPTTNVAAEVLQVPALVLGHGVLGLVNALIAGMAPDLA